MDLQSLVKHGSMIGTIVEGTGWVLEETIGKAVATGDEDLLSRLLVSAAEISARQLAQGLLEAEMYVPLAVAACRRRQPRRPGEGGAGAGVAGRIFRDIDSEDGARGVPDYIRADIEEMAKTATQTRASAMGREAAMDRDPVRQYIVNNLALKMPTSEAAMDALVAIARACVWEETRRTAALKIANDPISVARLARTLRSDDIADIARTALLKQVAETFAREMGRSFQAYADKKDAAGLRFIAEHHPDQRFKDSATQWAEAVERESKGA